MIGGDEPINKIILGPIHTLHKLNGELATTTFWYEANYIKPLFPSSITNDYKKLKKHEKIIRSKINKSRYNLEIENSILKYTRALDERAFNNSFLSLWSLLENLTANPASYDDVIKRTLFLYKDREFHNIILEHLRSYRNKTVHTGESISEEVEILLYQLKGYVERLLRFHVFYNFMFDSLKESASFLDANTGKDDSWEVNISKLEEKIIVESKNISLMKSAVKLLKNYS